jgi:Transmembrane domain of unknown function (DUF3566)
LDRRTNTSDGSAGATPTVVTARHDNNDLTAEDDQPTQILGARSVRTAARPDTATAKPAPGKEASANGSSAGDGVEAAEADVPALPADSIRTTRDSFTSSRSAPAPASPGADDLMPSDNGMPQAAEVEAEPASARTGTGWPAGSALFGTAEGSGQDSSPADPAQPSGGPESGAVSAAAFVWDPPEPAPTSPSSPARNFLRASANAKASASQRTPPVSVGPAKAGSAAAGPALARDARPKGSARRSARQAHLTVARIEPWSVMKFSFVVSLVAFVILFVAVSVIYGTLSALGVFTSLQHVVQSVTSSQDSNGVNAAKWFTASRILSYTAMLGALNIVLITAMCTIGAVVYNLTSRLIGGVEVTLRETE